MGGHGALKYAGVALALGSMTLWQCVVSGAAAEARAAAPYEVEAPGVASTIVVDLSDPASAPGSPFPHYWERMAGSGRAVLSLRADYRADLARIKAATGLEYVRFHAIFHDEVGLYDEDAHGTPRYNFSYIDQIYDGLLTAGVRPFVELSFMPRKLARDPTLLQSFWYHPIVSPPKDYARWDALVAAFVRHLVARYGIEEVARWYFEVWNEPNIDFWGGIPRQGTYFELYAHTARTLKAVDARLRVGGPSTAQAAWVAPFLDYVHGHRLPLDFVSSHVYANDPVVGVFHSAAPVPREQMVCRAVRKVHEEIRHSPLPDVPLIFSEYNASFANEPDITDTIYMGPWLATTIAQCDGLLEFLSYWTFSDVFEEQGVSRTPFYGGFGLLAAHGIAKPSFNAFELLHRLGTVRLRVTSDSVLATRRPDGTLVLALWNYAPPDGTGAFYHARGAPGLPRRFSIRISRAGSAGSAQVWRVDADHGNVLARYDAMGRPPFPTREQIEELRAAGRGADPERVAVPGGVLQIEVPAHGLAVLEIR